MENDANEAKAIANEWFISKDNGHIFDSKGLKNFSSHSLCIFLSYWRHNNKTTHTTIK